MSDVEEIIAKAISLRKQDNFEEAINILEDLLKTNSESDKVKKSLVNLLFDYGGYLNDEYMVEYQKSIIYFKRIIELEPNNYRAVYNLGLAYFNLKKFDQALNACNDAIAIKPDYEYCYYSIALIYEAMDKSKEALKYYEKSLSINPNFTYARQAVKMIRDIRENDSSIDREEIDKDIEKLKSLLEISNRISLQMIQDILKIDKSKLLEIIIDWGKKYQFRLDGEHLIINKDTLPDLLKEFNELKI